MIERTPNSSRVGDPLVTGYWCWGAYHWAVGAGAVDHATLNPLMLRPYSPNQPEFRSENERVLRWMWTLREATAGRGIWLIGRGADRPEVLSGLLRVQKRWVARLREDRALLGPDGRVMPAGRWAGRALANRNVRGNAVTLAVGLPPDDVPRYGTPRYGTPRYGTPRYGTPQYGTPQYGTPPDLHLLVPTHTFVRGGKVDRWVLLTCGLIGHHVGPRQVRYGYALRLRLRAALACRGRQAVPRAGVPRRAVPDAVVRRPGADALVRDAGRRVPQPPATRGAGAEPGAYKRRYKRRCCTGTRSAVLPVYRLARGLHALTTREGPATVAVNA